MVKIALSLLTLLTGGAFPGLRATSPSTCLAGPNAGPSCTTAATLPPITEAEVERTEDAETSLLKMQLLQVSLGDRPRHLPPLTAVATAPPLAAAAAGRPALAGLGSSELKHIARKDSSPRSQNVLGTNGAAVTVALQAEALLSLQPSPPEAVKAATPPLGPHANSTDHGRHASTEGARVLGLDPVYLQGAIPIAAVFFGFAMVRCSQRTFGLLSIYFGVQTGLNLYMKIVLSNTVVSSERGMKGIPGAFLITAIQQLVAFCIFVPTLGLLWFTPWRYTPKQLKTWQAWAGLCALSMTFALNIGLNNLCLSLLPMSINLMLRSCIPLATWLLQTVLSACSSRSSWVGGSNPLELVFMLMGVFFAGLASVAKEEGTSKDSEESKDLFLGLFVGVLSLGACACNLLLAQWLGRDLQMNSLDIILYMSVPAAVFLTPLVFFMSHPVGWRNFGPMTDWQVLQQVLGLHPAVLALAVLSGVFAIMYNGLNYALVSELSATHTAFAGNFNKAATIVLSLVLGLESLPSQPWGVVTVLSIAGGVGSFTAYSVLRSGSGGGSKH